MISIHYVPRVIFNEVLDYPINSYIFTEYQNIPIFGIRDNQLKKITGNLSLILLNQLKLSFIPYYKADPGMGEAFFLLINLPLWTALSIMREMKISKLKIVSGIRST